MFSSRYALLGISAFAVLAMSGCNASLDLDRFRTAPPEEAGAGTVQTSSLSFHDVRMRARNLKPHTDEHFEVWVVDKFDRIQTKAVLSKVTSN